MTGATTTALADQPCGTARVGGATGLTGSCIAIGARTTVWIALTVFAAALFADQPLRTLGVGLAGMARSRVSATQLLSIVVGEAGA